MKRIFISYSYSNREDFREFHLKLKKFFQETLNLDVYSFVYDFTDKVSDKELMAAALSKIEKSDYLVVELSNNSIGVGIEAGYAKAKKIPIFYLVKKGIELKQAMNGIADYVIPYSNVEDVIEWFNPTKFNYIYEH